MQNKSTDMYHELETCEYTLSFNDKETVLKIYNNIIPIQNKNKMSIYVEIQTNGMTWVPGELIKETDKDEFVYYIRSEKPVLITENGIEKEEPIRKEKIDSTVWDDVMDFLA